MSDNYHPGERKMQEEAGAVEAATTVARTVLPIIAHSFVDFIHSRPFLILGARDKGGAVWASLLSGSPGFLKVVDEHTLSVGVLPGDQDPLSGTIGDGSELGLLLIDFSTRRRLRINGTATAEKGAFSLRTRQVYSNCPRYIQGRAPLPSGPPQVSPPPRRQGALLSAEHRVRIGRADTCFVASCHREGGADVSHRGGFPGFVQVLDETTIAWPEYNGNGMFNTLGNILESPQCGVLFLDFETGNTLQLCGSAEVIRDPARVAQLPGAERVVQFRIAKIVETDEATPLRWSFQEYSPHNPWFC